jgi:undecaprenyl-diphosphatase
MDASAETTDVLLLAVVQGLAEFLPVSSSGHLVLGRSLLHLEEAGLAFDLALHAGTLVAVLAAYWRDVMGLLGDLIRGRWRLALWLVVASVPAGLLGILARPVFEEASTSARSAGSGLLLTALLLTAGQVALSRRGGREASSGEGEGDDPSASQRAEAPPLWTAVVVGVAQGLALWPGVSRSGSTIAAGLLVGLRGVEAARLSFLMSLIAVGGATVLDLPDALEAGFGPVTAAQVGWGAVVAAGVGLLSLRLLLLFLRQLRLAPFALYTGALGVVTLLLNR